MSHDATAFVENLQDATTASMWCDVIAATSGKTAVAVDVDAVDAVLDGGRAEMAESAERADVDFEHTRVRISDMWQTTSATSARAASSDMSSRKRAELHAALRDSARTDAASLPARFKAWLGVRPGEQQRLFEEEVRAEHPDKSERQIASVARAKIANLQRQKKSVHERRVSNDHVASILARASIVNKDADALKLLREIELQRVTDECGGKKRQVAHRMKEFDLSMDLCRNEYRANTANGDEIARKLVERTRRLRGPDRELVVADTPAKSEAVAGLVRSTNSYLASYATAASNGDQLRNSHFQEFGHALVDSVNAHLQLVRAAPDDSVFFGQRSYATPVHAMLDLLEETGARHLDKGPVISVDAVVRFMRAALDERAESRADIDRALVEMYDLESASRVHDALVAVGVESADASAALVCGVSPSHSQVIAALFEFVDAERFQAARDDARESAPVSRQRAAPDDGDSVLSAAKQAVLSLPRVSRSHLTEFMREPSRHELSCERPCMRDSSCVGTMLGTTSATLGAALGASSITGGVRDNSGLILREYLSVEQARDLELEGTLPARRQMCVLCARYTVTQVFHSYTQQRDNLGAKARTHCEILQPFSVITDVDGEYSADCCLPTVFDSVYPSVVLAPWPAFSFADYTVVRTTVDGQSLRCVLESDSMVFRLCSANKQPT